MRATAKTQIAAPIDAVWKIVSDPDSRLVVHVRRHPVGGRER